MAARDYKKEYRDYHGKPEQIKRRAARNQSRAKLEKAGVDVRGKDVDHKVKCRRLSLFLPLKRIIIPTICLERTSG